MKIFVLSQIRINTYRIVVHGPAPSGSNLAGFPWQNVIVGAGYAKTVLPIGAGPGQISASDKVSIDNGSVVEAVTSFTINRALTAPEVLQELHEAADSALTEHIDELQEQLRWFGLSETF